MKKLIATVLCVLAISPIHAQSETSTKNSEPIQTTDIARYKLYPTQNMWTFIKLDTKTGKMWQVQYSLNDDNRFECVLNSLNLVKMYESEYVTLTNGEEIN